MAADGGGKMFRCLCADVKFVLLKLWTRLSEVPCCLTSVFQYGNLARDLLVLGHL